MKSLFFLFSIVIMTSMTFINNVSQTEAKPDRTIPIPNIEFEIKFTGTINALPTLLVNGTPVTSSVGSLGNDRWCAYVDGPSNVGIFNFISNKCYMLKGTGIVAKQILCITFKPSYNYQTDMPSIEFNTVTEQFKIVNKGSNCSLEINSKYVCCK